MPKSTLTCHGEVPDCESIAVPGFVVAVPGFAVAVPGFAVAVPGFAVADVSFQFLYPTVHFDFLVRCFCQNFQLDFLVGRFSQTF